DILVVDLKDCFFTIPLHPDDRDKFAFTVPSINCSAPAKRYQWIVLLQGMKNSPTICQWYVDLALRNFRSKHPREILYHYMDDLLLCSQKTIPDAVYKELLS
ncbi:POK19 protein, partial [Corythaeola cristata]|nr:POK19 protein [Corythaeola cristata]